MSPEQPTRPDTYSLRESWSHIHEADDFRKPSGSVEFDTGEYLEWERNPSSMRLAWSTHTELGVAIRSFRTQFGTEDDSHEGMLTNAAAATSVLPAPKIARIALENPTDVYFYRVDYDKAAVAWSPGIPISDAARHAEAMLSTSLDTLEQSLPLIQETATPRVAALAKSVVHLLLEETKSVN